MSLASNVKAVVDQIVTSSDALEIAGRNLVREVMKSPDDQDADTINGLITQVNQAIATIKAMSTDLKSVL